MDDSRNADRIVELEAKVAQLSAMVEQLTQQPTLVPAVPAGPMTQPEVPMPLDAVAGEPEPEHDGRTSRRHMLRNVALVAGGAVAGTVALASPAAADNVTSSATGDGQAIKLGAGDNQAASPTGVSVTGNTGGAAFMFQSGTSFLPGAASYDCALAGWSESSSRPTGVYGWSNVAGGYGVVARGVGSGGIGARAEGARTNLYLVPAGGAAPSRSDAHAVGDVLVDSAGDLWMCVVAGSPGQWRKISGPATAGAYHAITPARVYDSRAAAPQPGVISSGQVRTISVADGRDLTSGAVNAAGIVPAGATAVTGNLTIADTASSGFLALTPGDVGGYAASTINWYTDNQIAANGFNVKIDGSRQVNVFAGGPGATNFIIDITGYFR